MGEKETSTGNESARQLNVSATPGGSEHAGVISAAVSSVGNLAPPASTDPSDAKAASNPLYADPINAGNMPSI